MAFVESLGSQQPPVHADFASIFFEQRVIRGNHTFRQIKRETVAIILAQLEISFEQLCLAFLRLFLGEPFVNGIGQPFIRVGNTPGGFLREAEFKRDVEGFVISSVEACDVAVDNRKGDFARRYHFNQVFGYQRVPVNGMNLYSSSKLLVKVLQTELVFGVFLYIDFLPDKFCFVGYDRFPAFFRLHQHLVGKEFRTARSDFAFVFSRYRYLIGQKVYFPRIKKGYQVLQ